MIEAVLPHWHWLQKLQEKYAVLTFAGVELALIGLAVTLALLWESFTKRESFRKIIRWGDRFAYRNAWFVYGPWNVRASWWETTKILREHRNSAISGILNAFLRTYAREEARHLLGDTQQRAKRRKRQIYTSFASYAALVKAVVTSAGTTVNQSSDLVCFTTFALPLPRWFNFHVDPMELLEKPNTETTLPRTNLEITGDSAKNWDKYVEYMHNLVHEQDVDVYRVVLVRYDGWKGALPSAPTASTMRRYLNLRILVKARAGTMAEQELPPRIEPATIDYWSSHIDPAAARFYRERSPAYIIAPETVAVDDNVSGQYKWTTLCDAFRLLFHQSVTARCFVAEIGSPLNQSGESYQHSVDMPHDFFLLGSRLTDLDGLEHVTWLFGLAARVGADGDTVVLELLSYELNRLRFTDIIKYAKNLCEWQQKGLGVWEMSDWLKRGRSPADPDLE